jgi:class 3 adenylate cyclase
MWFNLQTNEAFEMPANATDMGIGPQYTGTQFALVTTFITGSESMLYFPSVSQLRFISVVVTPSVYFTDGEGQTLMDAAAVVASSSTDAEGDLRRALFAASVTSVVIFLVGFLAAHVVARELNRPMERLLTAIRRLRALDFRESYRHPDDEARSELSDSISEAASAGGSARGSANASKTVSSSLSRGGRRRQALGAAMKSLVHRSAEPEPTHLSRVVELAEVQQTFAALRQTFRVIERFIPRSVVVQILRNENSARELRVESRVVTVFFSDLAGFTSVAEKLRPAELLTFLTRYLTVMSRVVECYEGTVAEIQGDGILAFWNTPDHVSAHAAKACAAAVAQQKAMVELGEEFAPLLKKYALPPLRSRMGLHTGRVLTGNIGSLYKLKYGCLGDAVNLGARLEGICKLYGASIICSADTCNLLPPKTFMCRKLDRVRVKGKTEPTDLFEVIAVVGQFDSVRKATYVREDMVEIEVSVRSTFTPSEPIDTATQRAVARYEAALAAFQLGDMPAARAALSPSDPPDDVDRRIAEDEAAHLLLQRIHDAPVAEDGTLPEDWDGVLSLLEKHF